MSAAAELVINLPDGWEWKKLVDVIDILDRRRVPINAKERATRQGDVPYYGATGQVGWIDDYLFDEELVLLGEDGAPFHDSSKQKAYLVRGKSWVNNHAHVLRGKNEMQNSYIKYYLDHFDYHGYVTGTTRLKLNQGRMKEIPIPVAPKEQRDRIVAEIEKQFSRLDEAVASLKRVKANLKRYKAAVLKAAVEGKLTEEWRKQNPDVEPASRLLERILADRRAKWEETELAKMKAKGKEPKNDKWKEKYKEPLPPKTISANSLPAGWSYAGIEQLLPPDRAAMKTGPFGSLLKKSEHRSKGVPVLGIENIAAMEFIVGSKIHITKQKAADLTGYAVKPGDVLVSRSGTVGEVCVIPENIGQARISTNLMKISLVKKGLLPRFFTMLFNGSPAVLMQVREFCKGSTRDFLNQDILKKIAIPFPPVSEQKQIFAHYDEAILEIDNTLVQVDAAIRRASRLRQSILRTAFRGALQ